MDTKGIQFLKEHESKSKSQFEADAQWERENEAWLKWSRKVATSIINYMQQNNLTRSDIAERLDVSPQYVSRMLSGTVNFTFKAIAKLENKLGIDCMAYA